MIKFTNPNTNDKGELFAHVIQGHYYSDSMKCEVLILQAQGFIPVKESWEDIEAQIKKEKANEFTTSRTSAAPTGQLSEL